MSHRVNIILQDENWETFQSVPKGKRSTLINALLRDWSLRQRRETAFNEIETITKTMKLSPGSAEEWVRHDRDQH